jgi:ketosteroid isomerase-like protein
MPEESTTPDLVELTRHAWEASSRHDGDALMGFYAPDAVLDLSDAGIGTFEGAAAIRSLVEDWWGTWRDHMNEVEEIVELGQGVVFSCVRERGRPVGSDRHVEQLGGWIFLWVHSMIESLTAYTDIDQGRAAAERLAEERG